MKTGSSINPSRMSMLNSRVSDFLAREIEAGSFPSAQYAIAAQDGAFAEDALGLAVVYPQAIPATLDTIYDLASLTKPLVTALLAVILADRNELDLQAPLARYLREFGIGETSRITITDLLTHRSGLQSWRPLYLDAGSPGEVAEVIAGVADHASASPLPRVVYSDLNYILLGLVLERITSTGLSRLAEETIFKPLGLTRTMFNPPERLRLEIAATERGREYEYRKTGTESAAGAERIIWGEVHDGNASFLGGVAGHAGLFSTAREICRIAGEFLPGSSLVRPESLHLFTDELTSGPESRAVGWLLASSVDCSAGPALPPTAFGHTGFTGTSVWIDPGGPRILTLLTNRVHPVVGNVDMKRIRREFHRLALEIQPC